MGDRNAVCCALGMKFLEILRRKRPPEPPPPDFAAAAPQPERITPIKVPNPPELQVEHPAAEVPKIGSRDAPGG